LDAGKVHRLVDPEVPLVASRTGVLLAKAVPFQYLPVPTCRTKRLVEAMPLPASELVPQAPTAAHVPVAQAAAL
jgi:hypothetical protein